MEAHSEKEIHEALYDGADAKVTFTDGRSEIVKIRKIPRNLFGTYALLIADESEAGEIAEAALYCDRPAQWAASLDGPSLDLVLAEGQRLNFPSFRRWYRRRARTLELVQDRGELMKHAITAMRADPALSRWLDSTNGSSPRDGATANSGPSAPRS